MACRKKIGTQLSELKPPDSILLMTNLHIQSVRSPFDDPRLASAAIAALSRADAMGLLSRQITCLDDNDIGVRRWFDRPRQRRDGSTLAQTLGERWSPDDDDPRRVRELARALLSSPIT